MQWQPVSQSSVINVDKIQALTAFAVSYLGGCIEGTNVQAGTSYTAVLTDNVIFMNNDAIRTLSLPGASPVGTTFQVIDNSGSVTAGHTITVTPASGTIHGAATSVITPGTNKSILVISDGTNYYLLSRF